MKRCVIIEVDGNKIQNVYCSDQDVRVAIADWDDHAYGEDLVKQVRTAHISKAPTKITGNAFRILK